MHIQKKIYSYLIILSNNLYYNKRIAENVFARRKTAKSTPILPKEEPNNIRNTTKDGK